MSFALLAVSTLVAFVCLVGFESTIAGVSAHATSLGLEIAVQNQTLVAGERLERSSREVESRIVGLHLADSLGSQISALFADVETFAHRRNAQVTAFRHEGNARFDVTVEGSYPATLAVLADLSGSHVAAQASTVLFERANGHVRAEFALAISRLGDAGARTHVP